MLASRRLRMRSWMYHHLGTTAHGAPKSCDSRTQRQPRGCLRSHIFRHHSRFMRGGGSCFGRGYLGRFVSRTRGGAAAIIVGVAGHVWARLVVGPFMSIRLIIASVNSWSSPSGSAMRGEGFGPPSVCSTLKTGRLRSATRLPADPDQLVFPARDDGYLTTFEYRRWFDPAAKDIGVPGLVPHELRHTCASLAIAAGANVVAVQRLLGHATVSMTLDRYGLLVLGRLDQGSGIAECRSGGCPTAC
jgi:hypothetical protein